MQRNRFFGFFFPIGGNNMVEIGVRVKEIRLNLGPALHYEPKVLLRFVHGMHRLGYLPALFIRLPLFHGFDSFPLPPHPGQRSW
jgi:hypothetical protein